MMKLASPLDLLCLAHPRRDAWISIVLISQITQQEWTFIPDFNAIIKDPANKRKQLRWRANVPYHIWLERQDVGRILGALKSVNYCDGWDIYYSLASYVRVPEQHRRADLAETLNTVYLDFDEMTPASKAFCAGKPYLNIPPPHVVVHTSPGRCQCLWRIDRTYPEMRGVTETIREFAQQTGADSAATDVARVFRLPGY